MRLITLPGIDLPEVVSSGSSSMSGFDEDLGDLELVLRRELSRLDVLPNIVIKEAKEDAVEEYCESFSFDRSFCRQLTRQSAVENINILPALDKRRLSASGAKTHKNLHPLSPEVFITPQSSIDTWRYATPQASIEVNNFQPSISLENIEESCLRRRSSGSLRRRSSIFLKRQSTVLSFSSSKQYVSELQSSSRNSKLDIKCEISEVVPEKKKKKKKVKDIKKEEEEEEEGLDVLPIVGGVAVALCVGAPVYIVSNIKLAMFTAIGGGIMGYTTGKMFTDWGDNDAKIKGAYQSVSGNTPKDIRKRKRMRRIEEYTKFKANCQRLKKFIKENQELEGKIFPQPDFKFEKKSRAHSLKPSLKKSQIIILQRRCFSMPNLNKNLSLQETILLWRLKKDR